jgi:serine/threonine-protein kinase
MAERPGPAYEGDETHIFVTYAHEDADIVLPQIRWLQDQGFNVWWDEGISPGSAWRAELAQAIRRCSLLLFFVTPNSAVSDHCTREVNFALDEYRRPVLAVHLLETRLSDSLSLGLSDRQAILRHSLEPLDYERKLVSAISTYLDQPTPEISRRAPWRRMPSASAWWMLVVGLLTGGMIAAVATWKIVVPNQSARGALVRFSIDNPLGVTIRKDGSRPLDISHDGARMVFAGQSPNGSAVYLRRLDELVASPLAGTESESDITSVLISPDGESILFLRLDGALKRISIDGGRSSVITSDAMRGMDWAKDGTIVFSSRAGGLMRVSERDSTPSFVTQAKGGERHSHPHVLADGSVLLFVATEGSNFATARIVARSLVTGEQRELIEGWAPSVTTSGHLLFGREDSIWAAPFDSERLELTAPAAPVLNDVHLTLAPGPVFSVADTGAMVYQPEVTDSYRLVWVNRAGTEMEEIALPMSPAIYAQPQISPDGQSALLRVQEPDESQFWLYSFERGTLTKLDYNAVTFLWGPDSSTIFYSRVEGGQVTLVQTNVDGSGPETILIDDQRDQFPTSRSADGDVVFYYECDDFVAACDIGSVTLAEEPVRELLIHSEFSERAPALSPDGRWLAYDSDRSGRYEIYVRPYPNLDDGRWQVSKDGGRNAVWSPDSRTLYYEAGPGETRQLFAVGVSTGADFAAGIPEDLFEFRSAFLTGLVRNHDLHVDGDKFLIATPDLRQAERLIYVDNWLGEVERLVPTDP